MFPENFTKFSSITIFWNTCKWLLFYFAGLLLTWRRVCLYVIYCWFIWFNYARSIKTKEILWKWNSWFLTTHYSVGSAGCFLSDNNVSTCADYYWDKNVPCILFYSKHLLQFEHKLSDRNGWALFVCTIGLYGEKFIYMSCMFVLVFQRKPSLHLTNRFNSLKHMQHFYSHNPN